jgi:uncharacterized protein (DUF58 family)
MLTRSGWGALLLAMIAFVVGRVFGLIELYVLGVGLIAAVGVAVATMFARPPRLAVRRLVDPSTVQAGDAARVDMQIANVGSGRSPVLQLWEPVGSTGGATMNLAPLRPRERTVAAYRLPTSSRGVVRVGPLRARRRDVLGLAARTFLVPGSGELLVMPRHTPVRFALGGSSGRLGDHLRMRAYGQSGSEFHSLREYVVGDDLRRISWKASARSNELIVTETALEGVKRCTVVFDSSPHGGESADPAEVDAAAVAFERGVSAAASLVTGAVAAGLSSRVVAPDVDLRGPDVAPAALRWLATVQPEAVGVDRLPSLKAGEGMGIVLAITTSSSSAFASAVRAALSPDDTLIVVATRTVGGGERFVIDATTTDAFVESWSSLTGAMASGPQLPSSYATAGGRS